MTMETHNFDSDEDGPDVRRMHDILGPGQIDASLRQTLQTLWVMMPPDKRNVDAVEKEFRRLVDRALRDLREDSNLFDGATE